MQKGKSRLGLMFETKDSKSLRPSDVVNKYKYRIVKVFSWLAHKKFVLSWLKPTFDSLDSLLIVLS